MNETGYIKIALKRIGAKQVWGEYFKFPTLLDRLSLPQRLPTDQNPTEFVEGNDYLFGEEVILMDKLRKCPDGTDCLPLREYLKPCLYCLLTALCICVVVLYPIIDIFHFPGIDLIEFCK